ncbi:molybdopterin synthase sulfur carrier subunit [Cellvibrio mixtus]|uniref:molybdopterin synthase sulfur carrier subunit n=1 Tax=Cellvibrio mixtus TaxID=39650 RepID=UPI00058696A4|nr:molybdopterin synthase sulfur carrier subunit [Cellvibrio mixtus]
MIRVVFFAQLREQLGTAKLDVSIERVKTLSELKQHLSLQNPSWESALANTKLLVAINHAYVKGNHALADGDEVAFFPPVTGG